MPACFVENCKNSFEKRPPGVTFHRIPNKYRREWLSAINRPVDTLVTNQRICSEHFSDTDFRKYYGDRKMLKDEAVPSVNINNPSSKISSPTQQPIAEIFVKSEPGQSETSDSLVTDSRVIKSEPIATTSSAETGTVQLKAEDFGQICRCCLTDDTEANILQLAYDETTFVDIFKLFGTEVNPNDDLPKNICGACSASVINFYRFRKMYDNSLTTLQIISQGRNKISSIENHNCNIQQLEDVTIKEEVFEINISENELEEKFQDENHEVSDSSKDLTQHKAEKDHLKPLEQKCEICDKLLKCRGLQRHMQHAHPESYARFTDRNFSCSTCGRIFKSIRYLRQHMPIHDEKIFLCAQCGKRFSKPHQLKRHCSNHHTGEKRFSCNICGKKFVLPFILKRHMSVHTGQKPYRCKLCSKDFRQRIHLQTHLRIHTGEKPHKCPYCDKTFAYYTTRILHIRAHTGEKPYICDVCGKGFVQKLSLVEHRRRWHIGEVPYLCDYCGKTFSTRMSYTTHLNAKHQDKIASGEIKVAKVDIQCKICNKFYSSKNALKAHMKLHDSRKNFPCTHCGEGFFSKSALEAHFIIIHSDEKKFPCDLCGKSFPRMINLKQHRYIHSGQKTFTCKICSKGFRQRAHLRSHLRTHSGEKPYACLYCDKTFSRTTTRTIHVRSHTGERPFVCDVCSKGFYQSSALTKHRNTHNKEDV